MPTKHRWPLLLALALLVPISAAATVFGLSSYRLHRQWSVEPTPVPVLQDAQTLAQGAHLAATRGCTECHAKDLGGQVMIDDPFMGRVVASNLTTGTGGAGSRYDDAGLARAIRHGIGSDGRSLVIMPSEDFFPMSDADVGTLISYIRSVPAVDRELPHTAIGPGARTLVVLAGAPLLAAETVTHTAPRAPAPTPAIDVEYGRYVAAMCVSCHGRNYAGGIVNGPPGSPPSADLTPTGPLAHWTEEQFLAALREGRRPDGSTLNPAAMPWTVFAQLTDIEARAIWTFLKALPPPSA